MHMLIPRRQSLVETPTVSDLPLPFGRFVNLARADGLLVVQPRLGMSDPAEMRAGLLATKSARATTVGTITVDSYTRVGDHAAAGRAITDRVALNGYPIADHAESTTRDVLRGVHDNSFPVQVRHGSADPVPIFRAMLRSGLTATEGGPVSYCLPYSRTPLHRSINDWATGCELLAEVQDMGAEPHLETFGGCLLGQLCPPSLLIAMSILEAMFFRQHGIRSISLSYAQQTSPEQDAEAVIALRQIASELLSDVDWHVVVYAYMGVYPRTPHGALRLLQEAAGLAVRTGAARLIVKTAAEAHRIPTVEENVTALEAAARWAELEGGRAVPASLADTGIRQEARTLIDAVLDLADDLGSGLAKAFACGYLDVPYCLHPDNSGRARSVIDGDGRLQWSNVGSMPLDRRSAAWAPARMTSTGLIDSLSYIARAFDSLPPGDLAPSAVSRRSRPSGALHNPSSPLEREA
jgi:methylaspartate mutase epsilon subunit